MAFNKQKFAQLLKKAKGERSINKYGQQAGVDPGYISRLMRGLIDTPPSAAVINKLAAAAFDVSVEEMLAAVGYLPERDEHTQAAAKTIEAAVSDDPELLEFWQELVKRDDLQLLFKQVKPMSPRGIKKVIKIIKAIEDEEAMEDF